MTVIKSVLTVMVVSTVLVRKDMCSEMTPDLVKVLCKAILVVSDKRGLEGLWFLRHNIRGL